ncbi:MAG: DUF3261 domain-containing protein [Proteobacteria bacterium]|nr:DUF3261 domain-containing protein [Pseudomonadota bacterium]
MKFPSLSALFLILLLTACVSKPMHGEEVIQANPLEDVQVNLPAPPYPPQFTMNQQIILTVKGQEYDFIGYLAVEGASEFRALAFAEMGGKIFDLSLTNGNVDILKKPEKMPSNPLKKGVAGDIEHIYMQPKHSMEQKRHTDEGKVHITLKNDQHRRVEYVYSNEGGLLFSREFSKDKAIREISYSNYRLFRGWEKPLPAKIIIINHRWHYQIEVNLLKITPQGSTKEGIHKGDPAS